MPTASAGLRGPFGGKGRVFYIWVFYILLGVLHLGGTTYLFLIYDIGLPC